MEQRGLHPVTIHEYREGRPKLHRRDETRQNADKHQLEKTLAVRTWRASRGPEQRDETIVIACLDIAIEKDRCPDESGSNEPGKGSLESLVEGHKKSGRRQTEYR